VNSNVILDFYCKSSDHIESHLSIFVGVLAKQRTRRSPFQKVLF
jgi:hypothetical protein